MRECFPVAGVGIRYKVGVEGAPTIIPLPLCQPVVGRPTVRPRQCRPTGRPGNTMRAYHVRLKSKTR